MTAPLERLRARLAVVGAPLCVGIDPHPDRLPEGLTRDARGVEAFGRGLIDVATEHAVAVKLNLAFFEALGADGWAVLERLHAAVPDDLLVVLDAKRGDIGPSAERYAAALFGRLSADGVTLSPYLGEDAIDPFLAHPDRLVYVLARTTNPSAAQFQGSDPSADPLYLRVAQWVADRWPGGRVGLVMGATASGELIATRSIVPGPAFLVPGVGAQGGDLDAAARACHGTWAPGLVAVTRAIAEASPGPDWQAAASSAAGSLRAALRDAVLHSPGAAHAASY